MKSTAKYMEIDDKVGRWVAVHCTVDTLVYLQGSCKYVQYRREGNCLKKSIAIVPLITTKNVG